MNALATSICTTNSPDGARKWIEWYPQFMSNPHPSQRNKSFAYSPEFTPPLNSTSSPFLNPIQSSQLLKPKLNQSSCISTRIMSSSSLLFTAFLLFLAVSPLSAALSSSPYRSPTTLSPDYQKMTQGFKVYIYPTPQTPSFASPLETLFYSSLLHSPFVTQDPEEAHLFFLPFNFHADLTARAAARVVGHFRTQFIYWNRTLGADHFFLSCSGVQRGSNRNVVELKKNSVQVSCFPSTPGLFIPHKDLTLPPLANVNGPHAPATKSASHLAFVRFNWVKETNLFEELLADPEILVEQEPSDLMTYEERAAASKFCVIEHGPMMSAIGEAMSFGCVPVVITDRPVQDMPLMDVLTWQQVAIFVWKGTGAPELKRMMSRVVDDGYEEMREFAVTASKHLVWNDVPQPYDAFHMVMYQLWLRRHTIRYAERAWV